ncbi:1964_t:CDS:2 [Acaulospora colombiana]|uniref:1964_t:CDS:1 n=1 Tax=Acaulospora colombiana TaxID=27376 RepID=A0ACA9KI59_9GLOM|nr:1964_t:CDS:2 [Acaulospora colombiana]
MVLGPMQPTGAVRKAALGLLSFINSSPTPYHAAMEASTRLEKAGFCRLKEDDEWDITPGGRYYFTRYVYSLRCKAMTDHLLINEFRNQAALLAFTVPKVCQSPLNFLLLDVQINRSDGLQVVDIFKGLYSLRVRPVSKKVSNGYLQVAVETYGGGIWHSWFDRDLSLAGRVIVEDNSTGSFKSKLVKIDRPLLRIPTLAIHLDRTANENFKFNQETEFVPILGQVAAQLNASAAGQEAASHEHEHEHGPIGKAANGINISKNHHSALLHLLADELSVKPEEINDFELYCALEALIESTSEESMAVADSQNESNINLIALFNHEEIGSASTTGAEGSLIPTLLARLSPTAEALARTTARSFLISSDMGHGIHPNYSSKYQENHKPHLNGGIVLKTNAKQKYTTAAKRGGSIQEFEVRNDM